MRRKILLMVFITFIIVMLNYTKSLATTNIPKVYFEGDMSNMASKADKRDISIKFESSDINFTQYAEIKLQGTSSLAYDKKNYTIKFYEDNTYDKIEQVDVGFGWGEQSEYCLKANWIDKTHSRNIVSARIGAKAQDRYQVFTNTPHNGTIDGFPVEIYLNEEFLGLYTWNIPKSAWMWNMDEDNPNHIVMAGDAYTNSTAFREEVTNTLEESGWECEVGTESEESISKLNRLINFVNNSSDEEFIRDFELYMNKDSALNYLVMLYLMQGEDNFSKNLMLVTYDGNIWYPSLYDLDTTFGTWWDGTLNSTYETTPDTNGNKLWKRIRECFPNEIANRWFEYRKDLFTKESIMNEFLSFINGIPTEIYQKEAQKWGEIPGYGIDQIEEFLDFRLPYIDNIMYEKYTIVPNLSIQYSTQQNTNQNVIAKLMSNREDIVVLKDGKETYEYTYTFTENETYTFECQDFKGNNKQTVTATVDWIDKNAPVVNVEYDPKTETNEEVTVIINANEEIQEVEGWELGQDKCSLKKVYSKNISETVDVKDLLGNVTKVEINVSNISTIPFITSVVYSKIEKTNEDILVTIVSNKELQTVEGWTLSEDNMTLIKTFETNTNMNLKVTTKKGQSKVISILIENIDKKNPVLDIEYSTKEETLESVLVTIKSNEELKEKDGWILSTDKKQMKKEYNENIRENVTFEDLAGNKKTITIEIINIIKMTFNAEIQYSTKEKTSENVIVTIISNKQLKGISGWILSDDKYKLTKEYSANVQEVVTIYSVDNEEQKLSIIITNIEKYEIGDDEEDKTIVEGIIPNAGAIKERIILLICTFIVLSVIFKKLHEKIVLK